MITRFNRALGDAMSYGYAVVFCLTFYEVAARYLFNAPTQWTLEVALLLAGLHYILCGPQVTANDGHIAVTTITDKLSPGAQRRFKQLGMIVTLACCAVLAWAAWNQAAFAIEFNERSGTTLNSPLPIILKIALIVSFVLMCVQSIANLARSRRA
jgi:TRAP-type C4-dicarboxylate transport system permease small subunit